MANPSQFTDVECRAFAEAANPHQWLLSADSLHEQAVGLFNRRKRDGQLIRRSVGEPTMTWDTTNKATFLLCALALENAIKAFLVYEHPAWITGGRLHPEICSHRLVALSGRSTLIPYARRDLWVLFAFEEGNESWMRYPCGRRANDVQMERRLHDKLWDGYTRVMRGYGTRLMRLLGEGWSGPYGVGGHWEMAGEWLGAESRIPQGYRVPEV
jgi:hypothetical protein